MILVDSSLKTVRIVAMDNKVSSAFSTFLSSADDATRLLANVNLNAFIELSLIIVVRS